MPIAGVTSTGDSLPEARIVEIQRARILWAMVGECAERGAANVTVAHIVARAGVSRRTFYELYRGREECFLHAFEGALARASRYVFEDYDPAASWETRVRAALVGMLVFLDTEPEAGTVLLVGSLAAGRSVLERRGGIVAQMIALVDEGRVYTKDDSELPPLTAEGIVGGVLSVLHARLLDGDNGSLVLLASALMSMIVLPYLGPDAARRERARCPPEPRERVAVAAADPLRDLQMRLTYRTVRVLSAVAEHPGSSNRDVGLAADMRDQGQISKLLNRLARLGLIENAPVGHGRGLANAWVLTAKGREIEHSIGGRAAA